MYVSLGEIPRNCAAFKIVEASTFWYPILMCGSFPTLPTVLQHHLGVVRFSSTPTLATWRERQIPQVKGSAPQGCPPPPAPVPHTHFRLSLPVQVVTSASDLLAVGGRFPQHPRRV